MDAYDLLVNPHRVADESAEVRAEYDEYIAAKTAWLDDMNAAQTLATYHRTHGGVVVEAMQDGRAYGEVRRHQNGTYSYFVAIDGTVQHVSYDFETFDGARKACQHDAQAWA